MINHLHTDPLADDGSDASIPALWGPHSAPLASSLPSSLKMGSSSELANLRRACRRWRSVQKLFEGGCIGFAVLLMLGAESSDKTLVSLLLLLLLCAALSGAANARKAVLKCRMQRYLTWKERDGYHARR